jgi:hypothetical protein
MFEVMPWQLCYHKVMIQCVGLQWWSKSVVKHVFIVWTSFGWSWRSWELRHQGFFVVIGCRYVRMVVRIGLLLSYMDDCLPWQRMDLLRWWGLYPGLLTLQLLVYSAQKSKPLIFYFISYNLNRKVIMLCSCAWMNRSSEVSLFLFQLYLWIDQLKSVMPFSFVAHHSCFSLQNEFNPEPDDLWEEPSENATTWLPCANQRSQEHSRQFLEHLEFLCSWQSNG